MQQQLKKVSQEEEYLEYLRENNLILFECIVGSQAYGTALPTSDIDKKFVYIEPLDKVLNHTQITQLNVTKDYTGFEIGRYLELLQSQNPNLLELNYADRTNIEFCHPLFEELIRNKRDKFLSKKIYYSFGKYAQSQIEKARGLNKKIVKPIEGPRKGLLDFCWITRGQGSISLKEYLKKNFIIPEICGVSAIDHMKNCYNLFVDLSKKDEIGNIVYNELTLKYHKISLEKQQQFDNNALREEASLEIYQKLQEYYKTNASKYKGITDKDDVQIVLSSIEKDIRPSTMFYCNIEGFSSYCKEYKEYQEWVEKRNPERYKDNLNNNSAFDVKNMMHCVRLLETAIEGLNTGQLNIWRSNAKELLEIRKGKYSYEAIMQLTNKRIEELEIAYKNSSLPEEISKESIDSLLLEFRKRFYKL